MAINYKKYPELKGKILIDTEDEWILEKYGWCLVGRPGNYYLRATIKRKSIALHRFILSVTDRIIQVDHRDGNTFNFKRENLRPCTRHQNCQNKRFDSRKNSTGYKGVIVVYDSKKNPYQAYIRHNRRTLYLGRFPKAIEAAIAYNKKAIELFGEFASLNPIPQSQTI